MKAWPDYDLRPYPLIPDPPPRLTARQVASAIVGGVLVACAVYVLAVLFLTVTS
jgi:hypothetical protein